jgi:hypothetical protein
LQVSLTNDDADIFLYDRNTTLQTALRSEGDSYFNQGNVGIGVSSPSAKLEVNGDIEISPSEPTINLNRGNGSYSWKIVNGAGTGSFPLSTFNIANNAGTPVITALDSGNVGIGTAHPASPLEVNGNVAFGDTATGIKGTIHSTDEYRINAIDVDENGYNSLHLRADGTDGLFIQKDTNNVGIGTNSPTAKLDVRGNVSFFSSDASDYVSFTHSDNGIIINSAGSTSNKMTLNTGGSTALTIDASQNVGIGTSSPSTKLEVASGNSGGDAALDSPTIRINNTTASSDWDTGDVIGTLEWYASDTSGNAPYVTSFIKSVNETNNGTLPGGALTFGVADYNASGGAAEAMRIDEDGNVGIGTSSPSAKIDVESQINVTNANGNSLLGLKATRFGFSTSYKAIQIGNTSGNETVSIGYDPSTNSSGSFTGDGREILFRNGAEFTTPNSANNGFHNDILVLKDGNVGIGTSSPSFKLKVNVDNGTYTDWETIAAFQTKRSADSETEAGIMINSLGDALGGQIGSNYYWSDNVAARGNTGRSGAIFGMANNAGAAGTHSSFYWQTAPNNSNTLTDRMELDKNGNLKLFDNTANPSASAENAFLFCDSGELKVLDDAGHTTTISPHNFDLIPGGASEDRAWGYYSEKDIVDDEGNVTTTQKVNVDMMKLARLVEELTGEKLVYTEED